MRGSRGLQVTDRFGLALVRLSTSCCIAEAILRLILDSPWWFRGLQIGSFTFVARPAGPGVVCP